MRRVPLAAMAVVLGTVLLLVYGNRPWEAPEEAIRRKNPVAPSRASVRQGAMVYQSNCLACHGQKGDGNGPKRKELPVKPADLTDTRTMSGMTDGEIFWKVSTGRGTMPAFAKRLSEDQRWHLVNYLRALGEDAPATAHMDGD